MMRILATADTHLGSPIRSIALRNPDLGDRLKHASRETFVEIVDLAIAEQVDVLVLAGDIFDNGHPDLRSRAFLIAQLARASEAGVPTVLIQGNHDALLNHGELGSNIHLLNKRTPTVEISNTAFHGLSFDKKHVENSFLPDYPAPIPGKRNVGLMHTSLDGAQGHDPYAPCSEQDLMAHGFDLWCLGHIHKPFERIDGPTLAVMPGIPQPRHYGERHGGTVVLVTLNEGAPEFERRTVGQLSFTDCALDLRDCSTQQEVLQDLHSHFLALQVPEKDVAVRLHVTSGVHPLEFVTEMATQVLENIDGVFIDKVKLAPVQEMDGSENDELIRLMRSELLEEGFRQEALQHLEALQVVLPPQIKDELSDGCLDELLEEAIVEVSQSLRIGVSQ